jgi:hypothetical protein
VTYENLYWRAADRIIPPPDGRRPSRKFFYYTNRWPEDDDQVYLGTSKRVWNSKKEPSVLNSNYRQRQRNRVKRKNR